MIRPADVFKALQHATESTLDKDGNCVYISDLVDLKAMAAYLNGEVSGIDDEQYSNLQQKRAQLEANQAKMVESMKAGGEVDPAIADRAQTLYRKSMALNDLNKAVQMSTERQAFPGATMLEKVNATKLSARLQKLNDVPLDGGPSRLEQAVGKNGAQSLVGSTDFTNMVNAMPTMPSTGQSALRELLRNNTRSTTSGVKTDWSGVLKDLDEMGSERQKEAFNSHRCTKLRRSSMTGNWK